ncbi:MAG: UDP-glucuronate decarboxylase [Parcubacteria bacterium C7867-006]|nr:MAG: UDP-glucuronate decarboxylase [Parcubacteria bacterium C7867-006]
MKKILITGGAGFIGFHLAKSLAVNKDNKIVIVDNLQRGKMDDDFNGLLNNENVEFINGDLTSIDFYKSLDKDFEHIYHLAAVNGTKWFYKMPEEVLRINTISLFNILEWIKGFDKKPKLLFTSSNEAYAGALSAFDQLPLPTPENVPLVVEDTYNPRWTYGGTKLIGELFVIYYSKAFNIPAVIVRPHNFYGPRAGFDHVIPEMSKRIIDKQEPFDIFGADESRTFCYIDDAVEAMVMLMDSQKTDVGIAETIHIGNTDEITMENLAKKFFKIAGWQPVEYKINQGLQGSVKRRLADISKIEKMVGWKPKTNLDDGLSKTFEWYKNYYQNFSK